MRGRLSMSAGLLALLLSAGLISAIAPSATAAQPTHLTLNAPPSIHSGDEWSATVLLTDSSGNPLGGLTVNWYLDGQFQAPGTTSADGSAFFGVGGWMPPLGENSISVTFNGTSDYLPSNATAIIDVLPANPTTYTTTTGTVMAGPVVELSALDGSTVCPTYFRGNASGGVWDQSTLTCTLAGGGNVYPAFCVSASHGGCSVSTIGRLVIDKNVTVLINNGGSMAIYSEVDNYGKLVSDIVNYGVLQNHGTIDLNETNQLLNLPFNGLGLVNNTEGATINNWYYITNVGIIDNHGTINNYGQFVTQECSPCVTGTLLNYGTYVGSAPAPVFTETVDLTDGNGTADQNSTAGVTVAITGATGSNVTVSTQVQGNQAPLGLGSVQLTSTVYYDILIRGTSTGTAHVCITSDEVASSSFAEVEYWNGTGWVGTSDQTVSGTYPLLTFCGDIPVSALTNTPLAVGASLSTSRSTGSSSATTTVYTRGRSTSTSTLPGLTTSQLTTTSTTSYPPRTSNPAPAYWEGTLFLAVVVIAVGVSAALLLRRSSRG